MNLHLAEINKQPRVDWRPVTRQGSESVRTMFQKNYGFCPNDPSIVSDGISEFMQFYKSAEGTNAPDATSVLQGDISIRDLKAAFAMISAIAS